MRGHIVVVGSLNMDLVVRSPRHPQPGETILGGEFQTFPGGKGANQAVAAARLGGEVWMVGKIGTDAYGEELKEGLKKEAIQTDYLFHDQSEPTGVALITVDAIGQNTIVVASGANARLTAEEVLQAEEAFRGAGVVMLQLENPLGVVHQAVKLAHKHGAKVVLNPAPAQALDHQLYARLDFVIPNETELELLAGLAGNASIEEKAGELLHKGAKVVAVTLGSKGVLIMDGNRPKHIATYKVPVVDTTAAGDAFVGAFAVALTKGLSVDEAAKWGNAAGALAVTRPGAQPSLPRLEELELFLIEAGKREEL